MRELKPVTLEPIVVGHLEARRMLGGIGVTKLYSLVTRGLIERVYLDNKALFTVASIKALAASLPATAPDRLTKRSENLKYCGPAE